MLVSSLSATIVTLPHAPCTLSPNHTLTQEFLSTAEGQMADLLKLYSRMKQEYSQAVRFFGEDPVKLRIDDFFGIFASFIADFEVAGEGAV